jgi:hypothetical protein
MTKKGGANNASVNSSLNANTNNVSKLNKLKNTFTSVTGEQNGQKIIIVFLILVGIAILVVGGYYLYQHLTNYKVSEEKTKNLIPYIQDAKVERVIQSGSIPTPSQGNEFNMNLWIYISDYNYRKEHDKCILYRGSMVNGDSETNSLINSSPDVTYERCNPGVWLLKYVNTLRIVVGLETKYDDNKVVCESFDPQVNGGTIPAQPSDSELPPDSNFDPSGTNISDEELMAMMMTDNENAQDPVASNFVTPQTSTEPEPTSASTTSFAMPTTNTQEPNVEICDVENIPLQRWVNINVSVHDNVIDIAMDGQLVKSCVLSGAPYISTEESLYVSPKIGNSGASGGFNGYISNLQYTNKSLPLNKIYQTYKNGPTIKKGLFN